MFADNSILTASIFMPREGNSLVLHIAAVVIIGIAFLFLLTRVPNRYRKPIVIAVTFIMGWFYFLEFFLPGNSGMALARKHLKTASRQLSLVEHDLNILVATKNRAKEGWRVARIQRSTGTALADMREAKQIIDARIPAAKSAFDRATADAEASARRERLKEEMLERDRDGKIINFRTTAAAQSLSYLAGASASTADTMAVVENVRAGVATASKPELRELKRQVTICRDDTIRTYASLSHNSLTPYKDTASNIIQVVGGFSLGLGILSLLVIHGKSVARRRPGWHNSLAFYVAFVAIITFGMLQTYPISGNVISRILDIATFGLGMDVNDATAGDKLQAFAGNVYNVIFRGGLAQLQATMFALVAFYIISAAYRAFRIKSGESALMMTAALLVMLSLVPIGIWMTSWIDPSGAFASLRLENIGAWIMKFPNTAAQRGMAIGIGVGGLAMALRIWLSLERGSYFDKQM